MNEEIQIFKNEEFGEVRTLVIGNEPWFVGKDVAEILGYDNKNRDIIRHVDEEDRIMIKKKEFNYKILGQRGGWLINKKGIVNLLARNQTSSVDYKTKLKKWLVSLGLIQDKLLLTERKEIKFLDKIQEVLKPFKLEGIKQYKVLNYRVDFYIPKLNIAIEYDEGEHKYYSYEQQEGRQKEIEDLLGCDFVRVNDKQNDEYNIGLVLLHISNKL